MKQELWKIAINTDAYSINNVISSVQEFEPDINKLAASADTTRFL